VSSGEQLQTFSLCTVGCMLSAGVCARVCAMASSHTLPDKSCDSCWMIAYVCGLWLGTDNTALLPIGLAMLCL
jgi:hypothetical protein